MMSTVLLIITDNANANTVNGLLYDNLQSLTNGLLTQAMPTCSDALLPVEIDPLIRKVLGHCTILTQFFNWGKGPRLAGCQAMELPLRHPGSPQGIQVAVVCWPGYSVGQQSIHSRGESQTRHSRAVYSPSCSIWEWWNCVLHDSARHVCHD